MQALIMSRRARVLVVPATRGWANLQTIYSRTEDERISRTAARRVLYRNMMISLIGQIECYDATRDNLIISFLDYIRNNKQFDGLESIFLTLLNIINLKEDYITFNAAVSLWNEFSAARAYGSGPGLFYNVADRSLTFFKSKDLNSLRSGQPNAHLLVQGPSLSGHIAGLGLVTIHEPFKCTHHAPIAQSSEFEGKRDQPVLADPRREKTSEIWKKGSKACGCILVTGGLLAETILDPEPFTKMAAAVITYGVWLECWPEVSEFIDEIQEPPPHDPPTTSIDVDTDDPFEVGDGSVVENPSGDFGVVGYEPGGDDGAGDWDESGGACFSPNTMVLMDDGSLRSIDRIAVGDRVMARGTNGGPFVSRRVDNVFIHQVAETLELNLSGGSNIETTGQHRFFVQDGGFVSAASLKGGDKLLSFPGRGEFIVDRIEPQKAPSVVYNLTVAEDHTYYVGPECLLVHNRKEEPGSEDPFEVG